MSDRLIEELIGEAESGIPLSHPEHINLRNSRGQNALVVFLLKNIGNNLPVVNRLVREGASLVSSDNHGRTPLVLLINSMTCENSEYNEAVYEILRKNKARLPPRATSPYLIIYRKMRDCGSLPLYRHPIRKMLMLLVERRIVREAWSTLVKRMEKAIKTRTNDFVVDIVHSTEKFGRSFTVAMNHLLTIALKHDADAAFLRFLLMRGATPSTRNLISAAKRGDYALFRRMTDFVERVDADAILSSLVRESDANERILKWLLSKGGRILRRDVLTDLIRRDKKDIVELLYKHGTPLSLPSGMRRRNSTYRFVQDELDRLKIVQDMADPSKTFIRNTTPKQQPWHHVAQQSSRLPTQLARQLRSLMN